MRQSAFRFYLTFILKKKLRSNDSPKTAHLKCLKTYCLPCIYSFLITFIIPGQKIDFHHFPEFDPEEGESGDTLIWYPTDHLRIADKVV